MTQPKKNIYSQKDLVSISVPILAIVRMKPLLILLSLSSTLINNSNFQQVEAAAAFVPHLHRCHPYLASSTTTTTTSNPTSTCLNEKKKGYQFGDITKGLINNITKKDKYEFGDLSKHLDSKVKENIASLTNKNEYEFGDLTKYIVSDFTNSTKYEFGDITKEIIQRVKTHNYTLEDLAILVKALVSFGVGLSPVASFLPVKLLIDLLNYSIAGDLGTKVVSSITLEIDKRMKKAITGDESYEIGDYTKKAVLKYTGRDEYTFGDITKTVVESMESYEKQQKEIAAMNSSQKMPIKDAELAQKTTFLSNDDDFEQVSKELVLWDDKYLQALEKKNEKK